MPTYMHITMHPMTLAPSVESKEGSSALDTTAVVVVVIVVAPGAMESEAFVV
jgi:hypothetical protein